MSRAIYILLSILLGLFAIEIALRLIDPFGVVYFDRIQQYDRYLIEDIARGYVMGAGIYDFEDWQATINIRHERVTPDSGAGCRVVFLGDSVMFGWGVNDNETLVNRLAAILDIEAVNTGTNGYNIEQVAATLRAYAADAFVYLAIGNDADDTWNLTERQSARSSAASLSKYLGFLTFHHPQANSAAWHRYTDALGAIQEGERLLTFAFDLAYAEYAPGAILLPMYTSQVSVADGHPDATGHIEIAAAMLPALQEHIASNCAEGE